MADAGAPAASSPSTPLRGPPARDTQQQQEASPATRAMLAQQRDQQRAAHLTTAERTKLKAEQAAEKEDRSSERVRSRWQTALVAMRAEMTRLREDLSENDAEAVSVLEGMLDEAADSAVAYAGALEELRRQRDAALARAEAAESKAVEEKHRADRADIVIQGLQGLRPALMKMVRLRSNFAHFSLTLVLKCCSLFAHRWRRCPALLSGRRPPGGPRAGGGALTERAAPDHNGITFKQRRYISNDSSMYN